MISLPVELWDEILYDCESSTLSTLLTVSKAFQIRAKRVLLRRQLASKTQLKKLYQMLKPVHHTAPCIVENMPLNTHLVLGNKPSLLSKSTNKKYHASHYECHRIGLKVKHGVSKKYYHYTLREWDLRKSIARLYYLVGYSYKRFPFSREELMPPSPVLVASTLPPIQTTWVKCSVKRKRTPVDDITIDWPPSLEYCLQQGRIWKRNKGVFAEWEPKYVNPMLTSN